MDILKKLKTILTELLDIEDKEIKPETYIITDLGAESIDLLELAVEINSTFDIEVKDDEIFLTKLRQYLAEAKENAREVSSYLAEKYPFLTDERIQEILDDIKNGPVLKVKDLITYVDRQKNITK
ncbi:acyl carrier protein [Candidatus Magnetomoraceae bacterium gMMP-1]